MGSSAATACIVVWLLCSPASLKYFWALISKSDDENYAEYASCCACELFFFGPWCLFIFAVYLFMAPLLMIHWALNGFKKIRPGSAGSCLCFPEFEDTPDKGKSITVSTIEEEKKDEKV
mmetsp:Transcript_23897/g.28735  ORF Transcript_23897/g.28735 Transcript_23897/m.28735 type:complete len:119 (-) Transcript_23897:369-725(-)|eukprot:CAMPEP_0197362212 /NCGR_PEP_ID=MMETSP0893-20130614/63860_1 /TAXON_ID=44058 ORGANISM="Aureoumbra lagunensis, Strain CCMP1510" /NCGR_SAMPLE_ID=MMETSP0893 /ASSEMBLY_ACC=CAM_ASM_000539 /LENGTH=118 /DNA_ID=CAMNT_0042883933 /DNA_START=88 /DNA_END=444 /DNA_ORIENTATION=-